MKSINRTEIHQGFQNWGDDDLKWPVIIGIFQYHLAFSSGLFLAEIKNLYNQQKLTIIQSFDFSLYFKVSNIHMTKNSKW